MAKRENIKNHNIWKIKKVRFPIQKSGCQIPIVVERPLLKSKFHLHYLSPQTIATYSINNIHLPTYDMAKLCIVLFITSLMTTSLKYTHCFNPNNMELIKAQQRETVTNLQFYFHDMVSGKNPTAIKVAQSAQTEKSPTLFGAIMMADDPLTEGPDPNSKLVGRAQGLYGSAGQSEMCLIMAMNFAFTDGIYNGSSVSILGKNSALNPVREMAIVGGTGLFRLARGYAIAKTHWFDIKTGDAIVRYNVTVVH